MKRMLLILSIILIGSFMMGACGAPSPTPEVTQSVELEVTPTPQVTQAVELEVTPPTAEKVLRLRLATSDIQSLDPATMATNEDANVARNVLEGLVQFLPGSNKVVNLLAETIEVSEDGLRVSFKLREGVQFHGGYGELTAEDVKFSFERIADPANESPYAGDWAALDHVEVTDRYTGVIILKYAFAPLFQSTLPTPGVGGYIVSKAAVEDLGDSFATHPIGTGPYEFVEWVPNQKAELRRFEQYWGDRPEWDRVIFLPILDDSAAEIALEAGEIDFGTIPPDSVERFRNDSRFTVTELVKTDYYWIAMNVQDPALQDINVRQAIRYAIDPQSIIDAAYNGSWSRTCALIAPGVLGYWKDAPCYGQDLSVARSYMEKAGLKSLDLTLTVIQTDADQTAAQVIQANLAEIGINVKIVVEDSATYYDIESEGIADRQLVYVFYGANPDPSWFTMWFTCDQIGQWNWMNWCNPEFDSLHADGLKSLDTQTREDIYIKMQQLMDKDVIAVWVANATELNVSRADIIPMLDIAGRYCAFGFHSK